MKVHGLELHPGTVIKNANIRSADTFPDNEITTKGQLFFKSDENTLYVRNADNDAWNKLGIQELSQLMDVDLTGITDGQSLAYDQTSETWFPVTYAEPTQKYLNDIEDVDVSSSTQNGKVLTYNGTTQMWEGMTIVDEGSVSVITDGISIDGTVIHDDGNGNIVTIDLNSENIPFQEDSGSPSLESDNVRDAILEVRELAEASMTDLDGTEIPLAGVGGGITNVDIDGGHVITATLFGGTHQFNFSSGSSREIISWWMHLENADGSAVEFLFDGTPIYLENALNLGVSGFYIIHFNKSSMIVSLTAIKVE